MGKQQLPNPLSPRSSRTSTATTYGEFAGSSASSSSSSIEQPPASSLDSVIIPGHTSPIKQWRLSFKAPVPHKLHFGGGAGNDHSNSGAKKSPLFATSPSPGAPAESVLNQFADWIAELRSESPDGTSSKRRRLHRSILPKFLVDLGRFVNPF